MDISNISSERAELEMYRAKKTQHNAQRKTYAREHNKNLTISFNDKSQLDVALLAYLDTVQQQTNQSRQQIIKKALCLMSHNAELLHLYDITY